MDSTQEYITQEQRILSFCYGYGGLERGISKVIPIKPVAYVEIEAFQNFNLVSAMEAGLVDKAPIWTNLKTFDGKPFHNRIHGIVGGYPCQGESHAGKRELWKDDRFLWPYIEKAIIASNPFWCFFENVAGHLTGSFPYILDSLRSLGYSVEAGLFTADEVGSPQERKRTFILALANTENFRNRTKFRGFFGKNKETQKRNENAKFINSSKTELGNTKRVLSQGCELRSGEKQLRGAGNELSNSSSHRNGESCQEHQTRKFIDDGNQWPAKRGQPQYKWEAPRTVEPGVGCTINGYNFRTELLRQYGNGVVSQTAEKAFRMLLDKHIKNLKLV